jgi:hypothetical protein
MIHWGRALRGPNAFLFSPAVPYLARPTSLPLDTVQHCSSCTSFAAVLESASGTVSGLISDIAKPTLLAPAATSPANDRL